MTLLRKNIFQTASIGLLYGDESNFVSAVHITDSCSSNTSLTSPYGRICSNVKSESLRWLYAEEIQKQWHDPCVHATSELPLKSLNIRPDPLRLPSLESCEASLSNFTDEICASFGSWPLHVTSLYVINKAISLRGRVEAHDEKKESLLGLLKSRGRQGTVFPT